MRHAIPLLLAALLPPAAAAQDACPTRADLAGGIEVSYADGRRDLFLAAEQPAVLRLDRAEADGSLDRVELGQGIHWLTWAVVEPPGSVSAYDYGVAPAALPVPEAGARWSADITDGATPYRLSLAAGATASLAIGPCLYDAVEVLTVWQAAGEGPATVILTDRVQYLSALGLAVEVELQVADEPPETWSPTGIRRAG